jgi:hypothetical protein
MIATAPSTIQPIQVARTQPPVIQLEAPRRSNRKKAPSSSQAPPLSGPSSETFSQLPVPTKKSKGQDNLKTVSKTTSNDKGKAKETM